MTLGHQENPIITVWKEEGEAKWISGVKDNEVVHDLNNRITGHISRDDTCTWIEVTQLISMWTRVVDLDGTQPERETIEVVIQEDQDGDLGLAT